MTEEVVQGEPLPPVFPAIALPSGETVRADFCTSLLGMAGFFISHPVEGFENQGFRTFNHKGSILPRSRQKLVQNAIEAECTHILFVDSDMTFPPQTLTFLLQHGKDVVAANCATKMVPPTPTARLRGNTPAGEPLYSHGRTGLQKVWRVGTGIMLIKLSVFERLPKPWFDTAWVEELNDHMGEDWYFCQLCEDAGIDLWVDHDFSQFVGHQGSFTFEQKHIPLPKPSIVLPGR